MPLQPSLRTSSGRHVAIMRKQQYRTSEYKCTFIVFEGRPEAPARATDRQRSLNRGGCREYLKEVVNVAQRHSCSCNCPCSRKFRASSTVFARGGGYGDGGGGDGFRGNHFGGGFGGTPGDGYGGYGNPPAVCVADFTG